MLWLLYKKAIQRRKHDEEEHVWMTKWSICVCGLKGVVFFVVSDEKKGGKELAGACVYV